MSLKESFHVPKKYESRQPTPCESFEIYIGEDKKWRSHQPVRVAVGVVSHIPGARETIRSGATRYEIPQEYCIGMSTLRAVVACLEAVPKYTPDFKRIDQAVITSRVVRALWDVKVLFRVAPAADKLDIDWLARAACDAIITIIREARDATAVENAFALSDMNSYTEIRPPSEFEFHNACVANDESIPNILESKETDETTEDDNAIWDDAVMVEPKTQPGIEKQDIHTYSIMERPIPHPELENMCPMHGCKARLVRGWRHKCRICHKDVCYECCTKKDITEEQKEAFDVLVKRTPVQSVTSMAVKVVTDPRNAFKEYVCLECARVCESPERKLVLARTVFAMCMFRRPCPGDGADAAPPMSLVLTDLVKLTGVQKYMWGDAATSLLQDVMMLQHKTAHDALKAKEQHFLRHNRSLLLGHARWFVQLVRGADWRTCSFPADFMGERVLSCEIVGCPTPCCATASAVLDPNMAYEILCGYTGELWGDSNNGWSKSLVNLRTACIASLESAWCGQDAPPAAAHDGASATDKARAGMHAATETITPFAIKQTLWFLPGLVRAVVNERYNVEQSALLAYLHRCARRSVDVCISLYWALQEHVWHGRVGMSLAMSMLLHEEIDRKVRENLVQGQKFVEALLHMHAGLSTAMPKGEDRKVPLSKSHDLSPQSAGSPQSARSLKASRKNEEIKTKLAEAMRRCGLVDYVGDINALRFEMPVRMPHNPDIVCEVVDMHELHVKASSQQPVVFALGGHRASCASCVEGVDVATPAKTPTSDTPSHSQSDLERSAASNAGVTGGGGGDNVEEYGCIPLTEDDQDASPLGSDASNSFISNHEQPGRAIHDCTTTHTRCHATVAVKGEDMRKDVLIMNVLRWIQHTLNSDPMLASYGEIPVVTYSVMSIGAECGLVEFVPDSSTVQRVQEEGDVAQWMTDRAHADGLENADAGLSYRYMKSLAASIVVSHVLGLGDRHDENVMITKDGRVFHIDFGFVVGEDPKQPLKPTLPFRAAMLRPLGSENSLLRKALLELVPKIYRVLRRHSAVLFTMIMEIPLAGVPTVKPKVYADQLKRRFAIGKSSEEAEKQFMVLFHNAIGIREQTMLGLYITAHRFGVWGKSFLPWTY